MRKKIRIDRILAVILAVVLTSSTIMFGIRILTGRSYKELPQFSEIIKSTSDLEQERVVATSLLAKNIDLTNISEEVKQEYETKKAQLTKSVESKENYETLKNDRQQFELVVYDIEKTHSIIKSGNKRLKVSQGVHFVDENVVVVNKKYALPETYNPGDTPQAKNSFLRLIEEMRNQNFNISEEYIGYIDFKTQKKQYENLFYKDGQKVADEQSIRAGHNELQSGYSFIILNSSKQYLGTGENDTVALNWLIQNAHRYGFIIRFPEGKSEITGFKYQPSFVRYVGEETAKSMIESGKTFEEYYEIVGGNYSD